MQKSDFCEFALVFFKTKFVDMDVKYHGNWMYENEKIDILFSENRKQFILIINLEKFNKMKSYENIFSCFWEVYGDKSNKKEIIFCLVTFKNKFILYNYGNCEKIYLKFLLFFKKFLFLQHDLFFRIFIKKKKYKFPLIVRIWFLICIY